MPSFKPPNVRLFMNMISPTAVRNANIAPTIGQGLGLTRW